jgi:polyisoprenoid-binding protein YceI
MEIKLKKLLFIALMSLSLSAFANESYTIDARHTLPSFEISHFGWSLQRGRFNKSSGKITLDRAAKSGTVDVTIEASSIDTGLDKLEEHLKSADFFNAEKFPTLTFKSKKVNFTGDAPTSVDGDFTMLGVSKPLTLALSSFHCARNDMAKKDACGANASATIKRSEFGMTKYVDFGLADEVKLLINVEAFKD